MDGIADENEFRIDADWEASPGVITPEIAATWARISIWVGPHCVTGVEDFRGVFRQSVYSSAYPLAEWIAFNWWPLTHELRASAFSRSTWSWSNVGQMEWLRRHNFRAAGGGMAWPDLTLVPEGDLTGASWRASLGLAGQPVRFVRSGRALLQSAQVLAELSRFVDQVLERLKDAKLEQTALEAEWNAIRHTDAEEAIFTQSVARLGLDPYSLDQDLQEQVQALGSRLGKPLRDEFLDGVDRERLPQALNWLEKARGVAADAASTHPTLEGIAADLPVGGSGTRPWEVGYAAARHIRESLRSSPQASISLRRLVPHVVEKSDSGGLEGFVLALPATISLVTSHDQGSSRNRFAQARALGLSLLARGRSEFLLDPASTDLTKESRAFAAELLAPASGIKSKMAKVAETEAAFDSLARHYQTSPLLIRHQYENQILQGQSW